MNRNQGKWARGVIRKYKVWKRNPVGPSPQTPREEKIIAFSLLIQNLKPFPLHRAGALTIIPTLPISTCHPTDHKPQTHFS